MAIFTAMVLSFRLELAQLTPHQAGDTYRLLLIRNGHAGTYDKNTTNAGTPGTGTPSSTNVGTDAVPVSGGYDNVNGIALTGFAAALDGDVAVITFDDPGALAGTTISADGCMIYNATRGNRVLGVFAFPSAPRTSSGGPFDINLPAATAAAGLLRVGTAA